MVILTSILAVWPLRVVILPLRLVTLVQSTRDVLDFVDEGCSRKHSSTRRSRRGRRRGHRPPRRTTIPAPTTRRTARGATRSPPPRSPGSPGEPLPTIAYTDEEQEVWRTVAASSRPSTSATRSPSTARRWRASRCPSTASPASTRSRRGSRPLTGGATCRPRASSPLDEFYGSLADRHVPLDPVRPPPGGAALHAGARHHPRGHRPRAPARDPTFGELHRLAGVAARRLRDRRSLRFLSPRCSGSRSSSACVVEDGELRAYGAGHPLQLRRDRGVPRDGAPAARPRRDGHRRLRHHRTTSRCCTGPSRSTRSWKWSAASSPPVQTNRSPRWRDRAGAATLTQETMATQQHSPSQAGTTRLHAAHGIDHVELWVGNAPMRATT